MGTKGTTDAPLHDFGPANILAYYSARRAVLRCIGVHHTLYTDRFKFRLENTLKALFPVGATIRINRKKHVVLAYSCNATVLIMATVDQVSKESFAQHEKFGWYYVWASGATAMPGTITEHWQDVLPKIQHPDAYVRKALWAMICRSEGDA